MAQKTFNIDAFPQGYFMSWFVTTQAAFAVTASLSDSSGTYFSGTKTSVNIEPPLAQGAANVGGTNLVLNINIPQSADILNSINSYNITYKGEEVKMPPKEFELVHYLALNKNRVFTRQQLLCEVWGYDYPGDSRTVDVHVKRGREKLQGGANWQIETVWGVGYKFEVK